MAPRRYTLGKRAEHLEATRRRIVDATFQLHAEKGIVGTSMKDVAERADVSLRTVYNHFPTLDALVQGCGAKVLTVLDPPTAALFEGVRARRARLARLVDATFAMYARGAPLLEAGQRDRGEVPALEAFFAREGARHAALAQAALGPFHPSEAELRLVCALTEYPVWHSLMRRGVPPARAVRAIVRAIEANLDDAASAPKPQR